MLEVFYLIAKLSRFTHLKYDKDFGEGRQNLIDVVDVLLENIGVDHYVVRIDETSLPLVLGKDHV